MDMITSGPYSFCDRLQTRNQLKKDNKWEGRRDAEREGEVKPEKMIVEKTEKNWGKTKD